MARSKEISHQLKIVWIISDNSKQQTKRDELSLHKLPFLLTYQWKNNCSV